MKWLPKRMAGDVMELGRRCQAEARAIPFTPTYAYGRRTVEAVNDEPSSRLARPV